MNCFFLKYTSLKPRKEHSTMAQQAVAEVKPKATPDMDTLIHLGVMLYRYNHLLRGREKLESMIKYFSEEATELWEPQHFECDRLSAVTKLRTHLQKLASYETPEDFAEQCADLGFIEQEALRAVTPASNYGSMCRLQSAIGNHPENPEKPDPDERANRAKNILAHLKGTVLAQYDNALKQCLTDLEAARNVVAEPHKKKPRSD